jgi:osmotically-inducible protein OsmY
MTQERPQRCITQERTSFMNSTSNRILLVSLLLGVAACNRPDASASDSQGATVAKVPADNTDKNERDRDGNTLTPGDQAENDIDRTITQKVRQAVVAKDGLSMNAKNVKIITANGIVTLRGPVKTASEKADIAAMAQGTAGVTRVDNQLEVAAEPH